MFFFLSWFSFFFGPGVQPGVFFFLCAIFFGVTPLFGQILWPGQGPGLWSQSQPQLLGCTKSRRKLLQPVPSTIKHDEQRWCFWAEKSVFHVFQLSFRSKDIEQLLNGLAQAAWSYTFDVSSFCAPNSPAMAPMKAMKAMKAMKEMKAMKTMKAKATMKAMKTSKLMSKGALATELAEASGLKKSEISTVLETLAEIGTKEVKKAGKFTLPGLCMIKTRHKKATKAGKRMMFGQEVKVKAQPAKTVVKAFPVAALKQQIWSGFEARVYHWWYLPHQVLETKVLRVCIVCPVARFDAPCWAFKPVWTFFENAAAPEKKALQGKPEITKPYGSEVFALQPNMDWTCYVSYVVDPFVYGTDGEVASSDDGEPAGTAGAARIWKVMKSSGVWCVMWSIWA